MRIQGRAASTFVSSRHVQERISKALENLEPRQLLSFTAHINFQPALSPVPAGYLVDAGKGYGSRGNGLTYGWSAGITSNAKDRNSPLSPDQRYDTLVQMHGGRNKLYNWEIAVPNGSYQVHLVAGDAATTNAVYKINVEGSLAINAVPTASSRWAESTVTVNVTDGRLTVSNASGAVNNAIDFIDIADVPAPTPTPTPTPTPSGTATIGTNLDGLADWGTISPFTDLSTIFRQWGTVTTPYQPDSSIPLTADNYPLADAGTMTYARAYPDGQYQVSYDGTGSLKFSLANSTYTVTSHVGDHWTGVLDLHHDVNGGGILTMTITGINPADPPRNLHIISPDADPTVSDSFRPVFLQKIAPFNGPLRVMDWMQTNNSPIVNWSDRTPVSRFSYTSATGVPYESIIKLANTAHKDLWINVPVGATDDYVHNLARLVRDTLDPTLKVYVEYSNELWNSQFQQTSVNLTNARNDATLTKTDDFGRQAQEAAKQIVRVSNLFRSDFGDTRFTSQVKPIFGAFIASSYWAQTGLDYIKTAYGDPKNFISGLAVAPYVGVEGDIQSIDNSSLTADSLFAWMSNFIDTKIDTWLKANDAVANQYGVTMEAYEGGQSLTAADGTNAALKDAVQDDPRMGDMYKHLINKWVADGGHIFGNFALASAYDNFGYWGALRAIDQSTSVKYAAVISMAAPSTSTTAMSPATTTSTSTSPVSTSINPSDSTASAGPVAWWLPAASGASEWHDRRDKRDLLG